MGINVFFTYFFLLFPGTYSYMIELYGYIPTGTSGGTAGYRAGIANHYSQNGICISVFFMLVTVLVMAARTFEEDNSRKKRLAFWCIPISLFALILTGKRGVLLWSIGAIFGTYIGPAGKVEYIINNNVYCGYWHCLYMYRFGNSCFLNFKKAPKCRVIAEKP